jgi:hypothetical protein
VEEDCERIDRAGRDVLLAAACIAPRGGWKPLPD